MTGDDVVPEQLYRNDDGRLWTYVDPLQHTLYLDTHLFERAPGRLRADRQLVDTTGPVAARVVAECVTLTLARLAAVTRPGVLTSLNPDARGRVRPASVDYLCDGVNDIWTQPLVTAVVRRRPTSAAELITDGDGLVHLLLTMTPRGATWRRILKGQPVDRASVTYELSVGDVFDPTVHCDWFAGPDHPLFQPDRDASPCSSC